MDAEGRFIEYKEAISNKKNSFKAEIVSFLNSEGGSIYLGVDVKGQPVQFSNEDTKREKFKNGKKHSIIG